MEHQLYPFLLLVHILAALSMFAGEAMMQVVLYQARQARSLETLGGIFALGGRVLPFIQLASPLLLLTGLLMCWLYWGFRLAWVDISLLVFLFTIVVVMRVDRPWGERVHGAMKQGNLEAALALIRSPSHIRIRQVRLGSMLGLVFLMTVKPALLGALLGFALIQLAFVALAFRPQPQTTATPAQI